jgi:hypothetical protein
MAWFYERETPIFQIPSNHNTYNALAEGVFREIFPDIPANGPENQKGLSYWVRRGDLLLVFVNTNFSGLGGSGHVEHEWLDRVLTEQADAPRKLVIGHHPVHAVNGFDLWPSWRVAPEEGRAFWDVLVRHDVFAYVCSHILIFDVQVHEGILQVTTGGAGTYGMKLGLMPGNVEYHHLVQGALDETGLRYQVLDTTGTAREWLSWPMPEPDAAGWQPLDQDHHPDLSYNESSRWIAHFRISGELVESSGFQTIVSGWQSWEGPEALWIGLTGRESRLTVQLVPEAGHGAQIWLGPELSGADALDIDIAIHSGMGPGGALWRHKDGPWSSLRSSSAVGAERLSPPERWSSGYGQSGEQDRPFLGRHLTIEWTVRTELFDRLFGA